jgi:heat shock protein HslJ
MKYLVYLFSGFFLFACTSANVNKSNKSEVSITSLEWRLASVGSENGLLTTENVKTQSTLKVETDGKVYGQGGCNRFSGEAKITGSKIKFDKIVSTKMACLNMSIETAFLKALNEADSYVIEAGNLKLKKGNEVLATLSTFKS